MLVDEKHNVVLTNRAALDLAGMTAGELEGQYCPKVLHGQDDPVDFCPLEECVAEGKACEKTVHIAEADIWIETGAYPTSYLSESGSRVFVHTVRDISQRMRSEEELKLHSRTRTVLYDLLRLSLSGDTQEIVLESFLERLFDIPWLALERKGAIFLLDDSGQMKLAAQHQLAAPLLELCDFVVPGRCMCGRAFESRETVFASNMDERHDVRFEGMKDHGHYCVPLLSDGEAIGVLNLYVSAGHKRDPEEESFLRSVGDLLAGYVTRQNAQRARTRTLGEARQTLNATVTAIGRMLEVRDPYTSGHQERVARVADLIAERLGWSDEARRPLRLAGRLHDIGKIIIPAEVLAKPGKLSDAEFSIMKMHCEVGRSILQDITFPWPIADIVIQHHEKLNGSGYPAGLAGPDILPEARILCAADVLEAVATDRPYRAGMGLNKAIEILQEGRITLFDADAVDAAAKIHADGGFAFIE